MFSLMRTTGVVQRYGVYQRERSGGQKAPPLLTCRELLEFGTIAGAESTLLSFDDAGGVEVAMTEAPHGTAPALEGKNVANPMAMILAVASLLGYMKGESSHRASRAIYESALEAVSDGVRTADLGGQASTSDFTAEVIRRVKTKVEVWSALADIER